MSLITQCPACTTLFKVVPDQLRISDGWVRCGQCDEVFDANAHLQTTLQEARQSSFGDEPKKPTTQRQSVLDKTPPPPPDAPAPADTSETTSSDSPAPVAPSAPEFSDSHVPEADLSFVSDAVRQAWADADEQADSMEDDGYPSEVALIDAVLQEQEQAQDQEEDQEIPLPFSFMQADVQPLPRQSRPFVRPLLWVSAGVLLSSLVLQLVVRERDWLAAKAPATKSALTGACNFLGCQVSALREIDAVVIDSSAFVKVRTDVYRVHFTLKNMALTEVATPAVELTLTNSHDLAIARKVFLPSEFGSHSEAMAAGTELIATLPISAKLSSDSERISGYRLLVFYP